MCKLKCSINQLFEVKKNANWLRIKVASVFLTLYVQMIVYYKWILFVVTSYTDLKSSIFWTFKVQIKVNSRSIECI